MNSEQKLEIICKITTADDDVLKLISYILDNDTYPEETLKKLKIKKCECWIPGCNEGCYKCH